MSDSTPVTGFEVGSGEVQGINDDGVLTAPIVGMTLVLADGERQEFILHPSGAQSLSDALSSASRYSMDTYFKHEVDRARKTNRRHTVIVAAVAGLLLCAFSALAGLTESQSYHHTGGVMAGVLGGIAELWTLIGLTVFFVISAQLLKRRMARRTKKAKLSPDPPAQESI